MATLSTPALHTVATPTAQAQSAVARTASRVDVPMMLAAAIGSLSGVAATWAIVATQTLHMHF